ncbi:MAG: type IV toxin-antitoxin system AbiEi family antitoxin domain-containing protein [Myxococcales bacterium]|nr:type IV toxin-antitoxin system AbiEi family antitoxin domain-containing protein [Myxococcales bacterium]
MHIVSVGSKDYDREIKLFRKQGGSLRMSKALSQGVSRKALYKMRDAGIVEPVTRGLYRLASLPPVANPDLLAVSARVPQGVVCLISALSFHELTTQVPHAVDVAIERGARKPRIDHPPTQFHWFSGPAFHQGIATHSLDGVTLRVYDPEKTLADCFRFRNQLGMDVVLEALRLWREQRPKKLNALLAYARMRHVERVMRPYLEALR